MENATKAIIIAVSVVIVLIIVSIGFLVLGSGTNTAKIALNKIDKVNSQVSDSDITMYDSMEVSGTDVVNAITKFNGQASRIAIKVITNKNTGGAWFVYDGSTVDSLSALTAAAEQTAMTNATDASNTAYINPNGRFKGTVARDTNGTIATLTFKQQ